MWEWEDEGWDLEAPPVPIRLYNDDLRKIQGDKFPDYGTVIERRCIHKYGKEYILWIYSSGWQQQWGPQFCARYRYLEGLWVEDIWYPLDPDWTEEDWYKK